MAEGVHHQIEALQLLALRTRPGRLRYHHVLDEVAQNCLSAEMLFEHGE